MIDMSSDADGIADFLSCLANLERKNSQLFRLLSEKIDCFSVKNGGFIRIYLFNRIFSDRTICTLCL